MSGFSLVLISILLIAVVKDELIGEWQAQYETGADPHVVLADLAEFTHLVTRLKLAPEIAGRAAIAPEERERGQQFAEGLSLRVLSRCWQMLLKGLDEVAQAPRPSIAADMVLVRLCHAASCAGSSG